MAVLELYGKCKELGYCDCGGFFGCRDDEGAKLKPADPNKPHRINADPMASEYLIEKYAAKMTDDGQGSILVKCEICERSHHESHPHIANIDGDDPIEDEEAPEVESSAQDTKVRLDALPDWLKDKPEPAAVRRPRRQSTCEHCGRIARSNHRCKAAPVPSPSQDERVAAQIPAPISVAMQPVTLDPELAAISAILDALEGLEDERGARILTYVIARTGIDLPGQEKP